MGSKVKKFYYMNKDIVMTEILLLPDGTVEFTNYSDDIIDRAFGISNSPLKYDDLVDLFRDRCFPEERHDKKRVLKSLGLDYFEPFEIVKKTHGVLFDDTYWVKFDGEEDLTYNEARKRVGL